MTFFLFICFVDELLIKTLSGGLTYNCYSPNNLYSTHRGSVLYQFRNWLLQFPFPTHTNRERQREKEQDREYIHQIGAAELWLLLTLQLSTPLSLSIHLLPSSLLQDCSKLQIHSMPSQMASHTVEACTTRFQHPSNKPSSQLQMACHAWFSCHRGTAMVSVRLVSLRAWSACTCVYVSVSVRACPQSALVWLCVSTIKCHCAVGCWFLPFAKYDCCCWIWSSFSNPPDTPPPPMGVGWGD